MDGADAPFRLIGEETVYEGYAITVTIGTYEGPDGERFTRDLVHHPGAVSVVPLHDDGSVTLVRQFRAPVGHDLWEIPAGLRDVEGEPPEETAARELAEEAGLEAADLRLLVAAHLAPGHSDEIVHVFVGTGLREVPTDLQGPEEEAMTIDRFPLDEVRAMIADGRITDAKTVMGIGLLPDR